MWPALLGSCRQLRRESAEIYYGKNMFKYSDPSWSYDYESASLSSRGLLYLLVDEHRSRIATLLWGGFSLDCNHDYDASSPEEMATVARSVARAESDDGLSRGSVWVEVRRERGVGWVDSLVTHADG